MKPRGSGPVGRMPLTHRCGHLSPDSCLYSRGASRVPQSGVTESRNQENKVTLATTLGQCAEEQGPGQRGAGMRESGLHLALDGLAGGRVGLHTAQLWWRLVPSGVKIGGSV